MDLLGGATLLQWILFWGGPIAVDIFSGGAGGGLLQRTSFQGVGGINGGDFFSGCRGINAADFFRQVLFFL